MNESRNRSVDAFHEAMGEATSLHIAGRYDDVLQLRIGANEALTGKLFTLDPAEAQGVVGNLSDPKLESVVAGNYRNIGATYERLGMDEYAQEAMTVARTLHTNLAKQGNPTGPEIHREIAADEFYLGAFALKAAMAVELNSRGHSEAERRELGASALSFMHASQASFETARQLDASEEAIPHQYELNGTRRFSMAESLYGDRSKGWKLGVRALKWAQFSEPHREANERKRAITKAKIGALGALGINLFARMPGFRTAALKATQRLL